MLTLNTFSLLVAVGLSYDMPRNCLAVALMNVWLSEKFVKPT